MKVRKFSLVVACIGATLLASCGKSGGGMPNFGDNEFAVRTIASSNAALQTTYPATIKGIQDVEVRPKVSGFITKVLVHEGQTVAAGQVLFTIDSETYAAAVRQARAAVSTAKAQLSTAKLTMDNNKKLYDKAIIGQYEYTSSANSYATAQAQLAQAEAALAAAREQLAWCSVKSPAAGVVGSLPFKAGALVSASGQALTTVSDVSTVEVFFSVSESELLALSKTNGSTQAAIASFPELKLKLADGSIYNHPGKVVKMSGVLDASTGSASVRALFSNENGMLRSGSTGEVLIPVNSQNVMLVPQAATYEVQDMKYVYVIGDSSKAVSRPIKVLPENDGVNYVVTSGLKVGDVIVTEGVGTLVKDGVVVKPKNAATAAKK